MVAIREEQGRYPEAIYWAKQFIERYPDYEDIDAVYVHLAWLQIDSGKYEEALATLSCSRQRAHIILGQDRCTRRWNRDPKQLRSPLPWQERCPRFYQVQGIFMRVVQARLLHHSC
jgi:tetratricopeptide (TPR) repeat protein